jgi:hypothetical protein
MIESHARLRPNTDDVAAKVIDGEAIIMNLSNGLYFSMDEVGSALWEMVEAGCSLDEMARALNARYEVAADTARADVGRLAEQLVEEGLVIVSEDAGEPVTPPGGTAAAGSYAAPTLTRYDDMADLLALDPPMPGLGALPE